MLTNFLLGNFLLSSFNGSNYMQFCINFSGTSAAILAVVFALFFFSSGFMTFRGADEVSLQKEIIMCSSISEISLPSHIVLLLCVFLQEPFQG